MSHAAIADSVTKPPPAPPVPRGVILCVDDAPNILNALNRLLRRPGHTVVTAESGAAGLELLEQHPVDMVISDMRMPQMSGDEFLRLVAERSPDTVRILLTGFSDLQSTIKAVNDGKIYRYLSKPWDDEELRVGWPVKDPILSEKDAEAPSLETIIERVYAMTPSVR